jgi:hypothetical protein
VQNASLNTSDVIEPQPAGWSRLDSSRARQVSDPEVHLLLPADDVADPQVSIVVPALNEELTVAEFVDWCQLGLSKAGVPGEILIVSSSTDRTNELALAHGARVLSTPKRGLGRAYIDAMPYIRGQYVLVGDADCTYDFREIAPFIEKLREGYEFVMGSRFRGTIEPKAMPAHHRYFGTPVTNWILNLLFATHFSDIHCGMRALTRDALLRIDLSSQGWEYASEMILKALHLGLRTCEIPINFYRDRNGRVSTVKRRGMLTPWKAGWDSLRVMFTFGADFFLFGPGVALSAIGLLAVAVLTPGPLRLGSLVLTSNTQFLAVAVAVMGVSAFYLGILAEVVTDLTGATTRRWLGRFPYNRTFIISAVLALAGLALEINFLALYVRHGFAILPSAVGATHLATTGILLIMLGFFTFTFTLVLHAAAGRLAQSSDGARVR